MLGGGPPGIVGGPRRLIDRHRLAAADRMGTSRRKQMPRRLTGMATAAVAGLALICSPAFAPRWFDGLAHAAQYTIKKKQKVRFKRPQVLPPNPCRKRVCVRGR